MEILKKIAKNLLIVLGVLLAIAFVLIFLMFFFKIKIFGYTYRSAESKTTSVQIEEGVSRVEIDTHSIPVNISVGSSNSVVLQDSLSGICKKIDDDSTAVDGVEPQIILKTQVVSGSFVVSVQEPQKIIAFYGDTVLNVFLTQEAIESFEIVIKTDKSALSFESGESVFGNVKIYAKTAKIKASAKFKDLLLQSTNGRANFDGDIYELSAITERTSLHAKNVLNNANVLSNHGYFEFGNIGQSLKYAGYKWIDQTVYQEVEAKSAKIVGKTIGKGLVLNAKNVSSKINDVTGSVNVQSSKSAKLNITNALFNNGISYFEIKNGYVNIKNLLAKNLSIKGESARVNLNIGKYTVDDKIAIETTSGKVNISGQFEYGDVATSFDGDLEIKTKNGGINLSKIACKVNAQSSGRGNIVAYFLNNVKTNSSLESKKGNVNLFVQSGTTCYLSTVANQRAINLPATKEFSSGGDITPIYGATTKSKLLTLICNKGALKVNEFYN